jgi:hypothetical protein
MRRTVPNRTALPTWTLTARNGALGLLLALAPLSAAHAAAPSPDCQPLLDAAAKQLTTPNHFYMTLTTPERHGKPQVDEGILVNGTLYVPGVGGKWLRSPITVPQMQRHQADTQRSLTVHTCRHLRDEAVKGEAAAVYSEHTESRGGRSDSTTWISKSRSLILKQETDRTAFGPGGKSHNSSRFEYANVKVPAGAR